MITAAVGGWVAAAVTSGPLGWPAHLLSWIYLAGVVFGYRWLRMHPAVLAARRRRDEHAEWTARKAEWHRIAHLIGLGDFHLQSVTPTRLGEELLLTSAPGSELATRVAANSRPYAEKYAHLRGLPYGRVDIRTTEYPEAMDRFAFDARWKYAAGGLDFDYPGFAHTVLVEMRARLARSTRPDRIFRVLSPGVLARAITSRSWWRLATPSLG